MQTQKEEIREAILTAAAEEFLSYGYQKTAMRNIAKNAGITAGNIYAYFENKEALMDAIVEPTLQEIRQLLTAASKGEAMDEFTVAQLAEAITAVFLKNRTQFMILIEGSAGSKYENTGKEIIRFAADRIERELLPKLPKSMQNRILAETVAESLIFGIFYLFRKFDGNEETLKKNMTDYMMLTIYHIDSL